MTAITTSAAEAENTGQTPAIDVAGVSFSYAGAPNGRGLVLENITLRVVSGERLGIIGPNGGGKTTLLKIILGLLPARQGQVSVMGVSPEEARRARHIGYVAQRNEAELAFPLSARQVASMGVTLALSPLRRAPDDMKRRVDDALTLVGATQFADRPIGKLSGGQVQRVMIARALACEPRILVLDEPLNGLDPPSQRGFAEMLRHVHKERGITTVIVSHDVRSLAAGCDRIACLNRTLHCHVAPNGLTPAVLAEVFQHDMAAVFGNVHVHAHSGASCSHPSHTHTHAKPDNPTTP